MAATVEFRATRMAALESSNLLPFLVRRSFGTLRGNELPDSDCPVKGNVNRKGDRIYHVKGWRDHAKVRLKLEEGDRCFQSVSVAELAGFRMPHYARREK